MLFDSSNEEGDGTGSEDVEIQRNRELAYATGGDFELFLHKKGSSSRLLQLSLKNHMLFKYPNGNSLNSAVVRGARYKIATHELLENFEEMTRVEKQSLLIVLQSCQPQALRSSERVKSNILSLAR